jgi:hypothetical protein
MLSITQLHDSAMASKAKAEKEYELAQRTKMRAIQHYKDSGDALIQIRNLLKPATKSNPVETDMGTFTGWEDYLRQCGWSKTTANDYINLAENWGIVLKLGMQDDTDAETVKKCMRLCRTLKVIRWYKEQLAAGRLEEELTLDTYWSEIENHNTEGPTKRQLQIQLEQTQAELAATKAQLAQALAKLTYLEKRQAQALTTV